MKRVVPLEKAVEDTLFGSKAVGLGQALRDGLPVPPGVALSGDIVEAVAAGHHVAAQIAPLASLLVGHDRRGGGEAVYAKGPGS